MEGLSIRTSQEHIRLAIVHDVLGRDMLRPTSLRQTRSAQHHVAGIASQTGKLRGLEQNARCMADGAMDPRPQLLHQHVSVADRCQGRILPHPAARQERAMGTDRRAAQGGTH